MAYKDKDKQREANAERQRRCKARQKALPKQGVTEGVTGSCCVDYSSNFTGKLTAFEHEHYKPANELKSGQYNPVSKPGDSDYVPQCETTRAFVDNRAKRLSTAKRGKDIKCFEDLPPNAQECINKMSIKDGKIDQTLKDNWMASVVSFQRLYPDRYESLVNDILV